MSSRRLQVRKVLASHPTLPALQRDKIGFAHSAWAAVGFARERGIPAALRYGARPMKASSSHRLLAFETFGEAATFDLEVEVSCRCGRRVVIDGMAPTFRDRRIMGTRFRCTTILPHGAACAGLPSIYIRKRGRGPWPIIRTPSEPGGRWRQSMQVRNLRLNREAMRGCVPL
jgi:hypothetical protein